MNVFKDLKKYQADRLLDRQEFNLRIASLNVIEELLEAHGVDESKNRYVTKSIYRAIEQELKDLKGSENLRKQEEMVFVEVTTELMVDSFCDIQAFAGGEVGKLGYDNELAMNETCREISSRQGEIVDGKFCKYKDEESVSRWYKADFSKALIANSKYSLERYPTVIQAVNGILMCFVEVEKQEYHHEIKIHNEIDMCTALQLADNWRKLIIDTEVKDD